MDQTTTTADDQDDGSSLADTVVWACVIWRTGLLQHWAGSALVGKLWLELPAAAFARTKSGWV